VHAPRAALQLAQRGAWQCFRASSVAQADIDAQHKKLVEVPDGLADEVAGLHGAVWRLDLFSQLERIKEGLLSAHEGLATASGHTDDDAGPAELGTGDTAAVSTSSAKPQREPEYNEQLLKDEVNLLEHCDLDREDGSGADKRQADMQLGAGGAGAEQVDDDGLAEDLERVLAGFMQDTDGSVAHELAQMARQVQARRHQGSCQLLSCQCQMRSVTVLHAIVALSHTAVL
jgi:hypothetical protein